MKETWVPLNYKVPLSRPYEISNLGNVRYQYVYKDGRVVTRMAKPKTKGKGKSLSVGIGLRIDSGKYLTARLDYLVAKAFIPRPSSATRVKHLDGDMTNNVASNLAWIVPSNPTFKPVVKPAVKPIIKVDGSDRRVRQYTAEGKFIHEYRSAKAASGAVYVFVSAIVNCCNRQPGYGVIAGYRWRWADDDELNGMG